MPPIHHLHSARSPSEPAVQWSVDRRQVRISKLLSLVLRHRPAQIGLELDSGGWASVEQLLRCVAAGVRIGQQELAAVVADNDKQRFSLSPDGNRIRANQGHSIPVDLGLQPRRPPDRLHHGTASRLLAAILEQGLQRRHRQQVHRSADVETAVRVGRHHGAPVVLGVDAARMVADGTGEIEITVSVEVPTSGTGCYRARRGRHRSLAVSRRINPL